MSDQKVRALGLDLSTSATGLAVLRSDGSGPPELLQSSTIKPDGSVKGLALVRQVTERIMLLINVVDPDVIVVEGYSLNMKNASSVVPLVELGGVLRLMLFLDGLPWLDPRATELKKFVTGKGNSPKNAMMLGVYKRWGFEAGNDNEADAYALAAMGLCAKGRLHKATSEMREVVGKVPLRHF